MVDVCLQSWACSGAHVIEGPQKQSRLGPTCVGDAGSSRNRGAWPGHRAMMRIFEGFQIAVHELVAMRFLERRSHLVHDVAGLGDGKWGHGR